MDDLKQFIAKIRNIFVDCGKEFRFGLPEFGLMGEEGKENIYSSLPRIKNEIVSLVEDTYAEIERLENLCSPDDNRREIYRILENIKQIISTELEGTYFHFLRTDGLSTGSKICYKIEKKKVEVLSLSGDINSQSLDRIIKNSGGGNGPDYNSAILLVIKHGLSKFDKIMMETVTDAASDIEKLCRDTVEKQMVNYPDLKHAVIYQLEKSLKDEEEKCKQFLETHVKCLANYFDPSVYHDDQKTENKKSALNKKSRPPFPLLHLNPKHAKSDDTKKKASSLDPLMQKRIEEVKRLASSQILAKREILVAMLPAAIKRFLSTNFSDNGLSHLVSLLFQEIERTVKKPESDPTELQRLKALIQKCMEVLRQFEVIQETLRA